MQQTVVHARWAIPSTHNRAFEAGVSGWGAPKIREKFRQQFTGPHLPAISTVHAVLDRYPLVQHRRRRRPHLQGTALAPPTTPNALWCAD